MELPGELHMPMVTMFLVSAMAGLDPMTGIIIMARAKMLVISKPSNRLLLSTHRHKYDDVLKLHF
jgi:hypothetical protein